MIKNLIILLLLILIMVIGFNLVFFSSTPTRITPIEIKVQKKPSLENNVTAVIKKEILDSKPIETLENQDHNLSTEVKKLLKEAQALFQKSKDNEALKLYLEVIKKTEKSQDKDIIKIFVEASLQAAFLYQVYPHTDKDTAIEIYENIIKKLVNSSDSDLLKQYINASIQKGYLLDNDERLESYDALIKKFENHEDSDLKKSVEALMVSKSFEMMGKDDDEALQILDTLIDKYAQNSNGKKLPEEIELAILNNIELSIITNNDGEKYIDLANQYFSDSPDTKPLLDMLDIIKNSQDLSQEDALSSWKEEHNDYNFQDWSFQELRRWANKIEDEEGKSRVINYINTFENHKYNRDNPKENASVSLDHKAEQADHAEEVYNQYMRDKYIIENQEQENLSDDEGSLY